MIASYGIIADVDDTVTAVAPAFHCVAVEMLRHLFLGGHGAEQSDRALRRSPGRYYFSTKEAPESGSNSYPPCVISPCGRGGL
jgi:hypothetical protein